MTSITMLKIELRIDDRWAVGGVATVKSEIHSPVLLDPRGTSERRLLPHLPATSLAGSLRRHLGPTSADRWLGAPPGEWEERTGTLARRPGQLAILGVVLHPDADVHSGGRTRVDPARGAAHGGSLRTEQWGPCRRCRRPSCSRSRSGRRSSRARGR